MVVSYQIQIYRSSLVEDKTTNPSSEVWVEALLANKVQYTHLISFLYDLHFQLMQFDIRASEIRTGILE